MANNATIAFVLHLAIFMWISWISSSALLEGFYVEKLDLLSILSVEV